VAARLSCPHKPRYSASGCDRRTRRLRQHRRRLSTTCSWSPRRSSASTCRAAPPSSSATATRFGGRCRTFPRSMTASTRPRTSATSRSFRSAGHRRHPQGHAGQDRRQGRPRRSIDRRYFRDAALSLASRSTSRCSRLRSTTPRMVSKRTVAATGYDDLAAMGAIMTEQGLAELRPQGVLFGARLSLDGRPSPSPATSDSPLARTAYERAYVKTIGNFDLFENDQTKHSPAANRDGRHDHQHAAALLHAGRFDDRFRTATRPTSTTASRSSRSR
jgi:hypothetical protein